MSCAKQRCICEVYLCKDGLDPDPLTHISKPGRLLAPSTVQQHRRDDKIWRSAQACNAPDPFFLLATTDPSGNEFTNSVVVSRTLTSEAGNRSRHQDHHSLHSNQSPSHTCDSGNDDNSTGISPAESALPQAGDSYSTQQNLHQYRTLFESLVEAFPGYPSSGLHFHPSPSEHSTAIPGSLDTKKSLSFVHHQESIKSVLELVDSMPSENSEAVRSGQKTLVLDIRAHLAYLDQVIACEWLRRRDEKVSATQAQVLGVVKTSHLYHSLESLSYIPSPLLVTMLTACLLHTVGGLSRDHSNFILVVLRTITVSVLASVIGKVVQKFGLHEHLNGEISRLVNGWPGDIRTAAKVLHLDPELQEYVCCARCFSLYGPFPEGERSYGGVPPTCTRRKTPSSVPCSQPLFLDQPHFRNRGPKPSSRYWYQPFSSWVARLMSRPDIMRDLRKDLGPKATVMRDIWDGEVFREFKGPDGRPFFEVANPNIEIRLAFSLFIDWFNPFGNKQSGKHVSFGTIYMVCHNIPVHLRYRMENVYIAGIIPGPKEPSEDHLNHILSPLVVELLRAWSPGFHLAQTAMHTSGCLTRCAIIPLVCDLLAARKAAGFSALGSHEGKFCSFCLQDHSQIHDTNISTWRRRTWVEHLSIAKMWRDAPTEVIQDQIYKKFGVRWSELLRLPYWNPIRFTVVDAMHNLFAGDLQHHCRNVFGMSASSTPTVESRTQPHTPAEQQQEFDRGIQAIRDGSLNHLTRLRRGYIVSLAQANNIAPNLVIDANPLKRLTKKDQAVTKNKYAAALIEWYKGNPGAEIRCPKPFPRPVVDHAEACESAPVHVVLDQRILSEVWKDMANTVLPTWVARAPRNFGSASHGKLKADQWRTVCLINLVITLCRIWGTVNASKRDDALLRNFLSLVIAVRWATMRSTSSSHAVIIRQHLAYYVTTTNAIFGSRALVYNNHASFHIPECLEAFGPAHGWWAFPFERYNGMLQRYNTNSRIGEMELTILKAFCRGSNLRALLVREPLPEALREVQPIFLKFFGSALPNMVLGDAMVSETGPGETSTAEAPEVPEVSGDPPPPVGEPEVLDGETYNSLLAALNLGHSSPLYGSYLEEPTMYSATPRFSLEPRAWMATSIKLDGLLFSTSDHKHTGNSYVLFRDEGSQSESAGQIQKILAHRHPTLHGTPITEYFLVLQQFEELTLEQAQHDPYRRFPLLSARLCQDRFLPSKRVIRKRDIVSHFATCPFSTPALPGAHRVVLSLNRV